VFSLVNITSKHGRKQNRARNTLLVKRNQKKKSNLSCIKEAKEKEKKTGRNQTNREEEEGGEKSNAVCENHNVVIFIQKYIWIILERDCSARGEKEKLLFSRVIHTRFLLMPKNTNKQGKKTVSQVYLD
jgi:hypothetical protein